MPRVWISSPMSFLKTPRWWLRLSLRAYSVCGVHAVHDLSQILRGRCGLCHRQPDRPLVLRDFCCSISRALSAWASCCGVFGAMSSRTLRAGCLSVVFTGVVADIAGSLVILVLAFFCVPPLLAVFRACNLPPPTTERRATAGLTAPGVRPAAHPFPSRSRLRRVARGKGIRRGSDGAGLPASFGS